MIVYTAVMPEAQRAVVLVAVITALAAATSAEGDLLPAILVSRASPRGIFAGLWVLRGGAEEHSTRTDESKGSMRGQDLREGVRRGGGGLGSIKRDGLLRVPVQGSQRAGFEGLDGEVSDRRSARTCSRGYDSEGCSARGPYAKTTDETGCRPYGALRNRQASKHRQWQRTGMGETGEGGRSHAGASQFQRVQPRERPKEAEGAVNGANAGISDENANIQGVSLIQDGVKAVDKADGQNDDMDALFDVAFRQRPAPGP